MNLPLRVLLVEDSEDDAQLVLCGITRGGYKVESERVETHSVMEEALARHPWDIIICDNSLPQFSAMEAIAVLKESGLAMHSFIILASAAGEESVICAVLFCPDRGKFHPGYYISVILFWDKIHWFIKESGFILSISGIAPICLDQFRWAHKHCELR